jgi:hypothetical protein
MLQAPSNPRREGGEQTRDYDYHPREDPRGYPRGRGPGHRRHLEKEARTRNLLDEQAIMRPKDLCKQQGLDMVAELRGMM